MAATSQTKQTRITIAIAVSLIAVWTAFALWQSREPGAEATPASNDKRPTAQPHLIAVPSAPSPAPEASPKPKQPPLMIVPDRTPTPTPAAGPDPATTAVGTPLEAALRFVSTGERLPDLSPDEAAALQASLATDAAATTMAQQARERVAEIIELAEEVWELRIVPVEARVIETKNRAKVSIWYVAITHRHDRSVTSTWRTVTYELVWERQAWRIDSMVSETGPTPGATRHDPPTTIDDFENRTVGFSGAGIWPWT